MEDLNKNNFNIQESYLSDTIDTYTFTVGKGKNLRNVVLNLDITPEDDFSDEIIAKELVQYISAFEGILNCQYTI